MSEPKRTMFAMQALTLAEKFRFSVGLKNVGSYRPELAAPEGESTGGGKQAVQPLKLVHSTQSSTLGVGTVNQVTKAAELRTFSCLQSVNAQRGRTAAPIDFDEVAYQTFLDSVEKLLTEDGVTIKWLDETAVSGVIAEQSAPIKPAAKANAPAASAPKPSAPAAKPAGAKPAASGPSVTLGGSSGGVSGTVVIIGAVVVVAVIVGLVMYLRSH